MDVVELDRLTPQQSSDLAAGEREPWGGVAEALSWREKDRHVGIHGPGGQLLAAAGSVLVEVEVDGAGDFSVLGIGGVFVTPSARGEGLVAPLLEALLAVPADGSVARAMLFCREPLSAMYAKFGFAEIAAVVTAEQPAGAIEMPLCAMWRPLSDGVSWPPGRVEVRGLPF
jgi:predicted GNAT family N-acyltransferase